MTLTQLELAKAVFEARSFSRAATACHISQPSLSNAVAKLEQELGGPLFARSTRRVEVTPLGSSLLPLIESVIESVRHLSKAAEAVKNPEAKLIRLGLSPLVSTPVLATALRPFQKTAKGTTVILKQCFLEDLKQRLRTGVLDLAAVPAGFFGRGYDRCPFYEDSLRYLPRDGASDAPGGAEPVTLKEIAKQTFVVTADGCGLTLFVRDLFRKNHQNLREYPGIALTHEVIEEWVDLGLGSGLLPLRKLTSQRQRGRPVVIGRDKPVIVNYELVWLQNTIMSSQLARMIDHFRVSVPMLLSSISHNSIPSLVPPEGGRRHAGASYSR